jgi:hypothetical protein
VAGANLSFRLAWPIDYSMGKSKLLQGSAFPFNRVQTYLTK